MFTAYNFYVMYVEAEEENFNLLHVSMHGFCGDHFVVFLSPLQDLYRIPNSMSYEEAAAMPVSYGTAWMGLTRRANTQPG